MGKRAEGVGCLCPIPMGMPKEWLGTQSVFDTTVAGVSLTIKESTKNDRDIIVNEINLPCRGVSIR